mmetsp:Transcript_45746/g.90106  ORF Transcript_45746/g.90106 Transcript_45746/m.90106 type:complete len:220 (+) Transcript_45746:194-853(+)
MSPPPLQTFSCCLLFSLPQRHLRPLRLASCLLSLQEPLQPSLLLLLLLPIPRLLVQKHMRKEVANLLIGESVKAERERGRKRKKKNGRVLRLSRGVCPILGMHGCLLFRYLQRGFLTERGMGPSPSLTHTGSRLMKWGRMVRPLTFLFPLGSRGRQSLGQARTSLWRLSADMHEGGHVHETGMSPLFWKCSLALICFQFRLLIQFSHSLTLLVSLCVGL